MRLIGFVAFFCPPALVLPNDSLMVVGADHKTPMTMKTEKFCLDVCIFCEVHHEKRRGCKVSSVSSLCSDDYQRRGLRAR